MVGNIVSMVFGASALHSELSLFFILSVGAGLCDQASVDNAPFGHITVAFVAEGGQG